MAAVETNHVRRNSYEYEDLPVLDQHHAVGDKQSSNVAGVRTRTISTPSPLSAGPHRTSFNFASGLPNHERTTSQSGSSLRGSFSNTPSSAGPYRVSFSSASGVNGPSPGPGLSNSVPHGRAPNHGRSPSINSDTASSPFRTSFPPIPSPQINNSGILPPVNEAENTSNAANGVNGPPSSPPSSHGSNHARRHSRIHSRNLSIYFPRPGATAVPSIAEDGSQELEAPVALIPSVSSPSPPHSSYSKSSVNSTPRSGTFTTPTPPPPRSQLDGGFKFGKKPPTNNSSQSSSAESIHDMDRTTSSSSTVQGPSSVPMSKANTPDSRAATRTTSRRGHHHKHSLSHSFFSFMEPSPSPSVNINHHHRNDSLSLTVTSPSPPSPSSPSSAVTNGWGPLSPFPPTVSASSAAFPPAQLIPPKRRASLQAAALPNPSTQRSSPLFQKILALPQHMRYGLAFSLAEGIIGCGLWVIAQHIESLACAGLAYWVVFDAIGVTLGVYGRLIDTGAGGGSLRLPYGAKRTEVLALFAQSVYLLFAAVYICKETLEHTLLSSGEAGHHHHHHPPTSVGVDQSRSTYPTIFLWLSFISLSLSSVLLRSNIKILDATGTFIPSLRQVLRTFSRNKQPFTVSLRPSSTPLLSNPYTLFPLICALLLIFLSTLPVAQEDSIKTADILIAGFEAVGTWWLAYPACITLGKVLLQTAPQRSNFASGSRTESLTTKGTMEALLRVMKEIERHPQVLHLPAPHVWQVAPSSTVPNSTLLHSPSWEGKPENNSRRQANGHGHLRSKSIINSRGGPNVIVAVEIHVKKELDDIECLELTRWAWQRCISALEQGDEGVTIGIVKG